MSRLLLTRISWARYDSGLGFPDQSLWWLWRCSLHWVGMYMALKFAHYKLPCTQFTVLKPQKRSWSAKEFIAARYDQVVVYHSIKLGNLWSLRKFNLSSFTHSKNDNRRILLTRPQRPYVLNKNSSIRILAISRVILLPFLFYILPANNSSTTPISTT